MPEMYHYGLAIVFNANTIDKPSWTYLKNQENYINILKFLLKVIKFILFKNSLFFLSFIDYRFCLKCSSKNLVLRNL